MGAEGQRQLCLKGDSKLAVNFRPTMASWRLHHCNRLSHPTPRPRWERRNVAQMTVPTVVDLIGGDGNCFFRAISRELTGSQEYHSYIRKLITNHMQVGAAYDLSGL